MRPRLAFWFVWAVLALRLPANVRGDFTFTRIADTSGQFSGGLGGFALNNSGTVAFRALLGGGGQGIFRGNGGPTTTIADTAGAFSSFGGAAINNSGTVAFRAGLDAGGAGIFTGNGGPTTTVVDTSGPFTGFGTDISASINDAGRVAFFATLSPTTSGIFSRSGGVTTTIAQAPNVGSFPAFGDVTNINDAGTVAFVARLDMGMGVREGVFVGNGGALTTINSGAFDFYSFAPSINNAGTVAFPAGLRTGLVGIFTGNGGALTTIADTNGPFSGFGNGGSSINDAGMVAFYADLDAGGAGIFNGPNPIANKVIRTGDTLDGSTVTSLLFSPFGLNDAGQVAFLANLADGRQGIYVAVPEPSSVVLFCLGGLGLFGYAWRRRAVTILSPMTEATPVE